MTYKNILFVCSGAIDRSPCASSLVKNSKFAGVSPLTENPVSEELISWSDLIVCMEHFHKAELYEQVPLSKEKEIIVLNVPNDYLRYDPELEKVLKNKLKDFGLV
jgi:predicted protein tyrosine phosphatase